MKKKPEQKKKNNSIGITENKENRDQAMQMLDTITARREQQGYIWVIKGNTSKQIHPDKLKDHLADSWKVTNKKNETRRNKG